MATARDPTPSIRAPLRHRAIGGWWLGALLLGGIGGALAFSVLPKPASEVAARPRVEITCVGGRSKAERLAYWRARTGIQDASVAASAAASVTYSRDVAPILFAHCAECHRPGELTPFSVLTYEDVKPWAWLIGVVTANRYMPPWPPEPTAGFAFAGERRLDDEQIAIIQRWVEQGAAPGDDADLPPLPQFHEGWRLGEPDLVVSLPQPYWLAPEGGDTYRNLVFPVPLDETRWVRAVEIRPGNKRIVHHAIMQVDRLQAARRADDADPGPGFGGMDMGPVESPGGHLVGWSPGKAPMEVPSGMAWRVGPGTDLILQLHMLPSGRPEAIEPQIGLYFTDRPARYQPFAIVLRNGDIDIPPGDEAYPIEESMTLPVDVQALSIYPHAHYLARRIEATATLPDGSAKTLISIPDWDFGWQDEYRYREPVWLPAGTRLSMRFTYDNSDKNPRNPSQPPVRVVAGNRSTDEMAILTLQVLSDAPAGEARVREAVMRARLARRPDNWAAQNLLGISLRAQGRTDEAVYHFLEALRLKPNDSGIVYNLANALQSRGDYDQAVRYYREALRLEPQHATAHNNLAIALHSQGRTDEAIEHYQAQLVLSPDNPGAHYNLVIALLATGENAAAMAELERAIGLDSAFHPARIALADVLREQGRAEEALRYYQETIGRDERQAPAYYGMGLVHLERGRADAALDAFRSAIRLRAEFIDPINNLAWALATNPDPEARNPGIALTLAELVSAAATPPRAEVLDTLAAAYAANGQFDLATRTMERALALLGDQPEFTGQFSARLGLYRRGEPYLAASGPDAPDG